MPREYCPLSDIADIIVGYPFESEQFNTDEIGVKLVRGMNVTTGSFRWGEDSRWWSNITDDLEPYYLKTDDIIIGMDGSRVGKNYAKVRESDLPLLLVQRVACIRAKCGVDQNYLWSCISSTAFEEYVDLVKTGTTIPHISSKQIGEYPVPKLDLKIQQIVGKFSRLIDSKIHQNEKINDNLLEQGKSIFNRFQCNASIFSTVGNISKRIICGKTPSTKHPEYYGGKIPFITIPDMHNSPVIFKTERYLTEEGNNSQIKKLLPRFTVCVSCIATPGLVSLTLTPSHTNQQINSIICKDSISPFYLYYLLSSMSEHIIALGTGGSATLNLNKEEFSKMELLVIKPEDMKKIHLALNPLFLTLEHNMKEINDLIDLRDYLLPKLMSGEIDVSSLEIPN